MIENPDEICPERVDRLGLVLGPNLSHLLVGQPRRFWWLLPYRRRLEWRCLYCGERAR